MINCIQEISKSIMEREFALFCGAGISKNSGLPLADELKRSILEELPLESEDREEIIASGLPFEAFMEILSWVSDVSKILNVFKYGKPNANHILIAKLAKKGYLKTIGTTNFDMLIEKALKKEGLKKNKDFETYCDEEPSQKIGFEEKDEGIVTIFKIHGSIHKRDSIRTTMRQVASKTLSNKRMNVMMHLFSAGNHNKVLVLGYSCSDEFDITPQIRSIAQNKKDIIFIDHSTEGIKIEDVRIREFKNPFVMFPGRRIRCNTDDFILELWNSIEKTVGKYKPTESKVNWEKHIDNWLRGSQKEHLKLLIAGWILYRVSNLKRAIEYYEKALEIATKIGDKVTQSSCYRNLGAAYSDQGDLKTAIEYFEKTLKISITIKDKEGEAANYAHLGQTYNKLGDFKRAIEFFEKALEIGIEIRVKDVEATCYQDIGVSYHSLGDFKKAIEYWEKALEITAEIGDKEGEVGCYGNLGRAYNSLGDFKRAIQYFERALEITTKIADKAGEAGLYGNLAVSYDGLRDFKRAIEYNEKALQIATEIGDKVAKAASYANLGRAYDSLGDSKRAIEYIGKALEIITVTGGREVEARCYVNLGGCYNRLGDFKRAIEYNEKALQIATEIGDKVTKAASYANLGRAYDSLGDSKRAIEYLLKAEGISKEIEQNQFLREIYRNLALACEKIGDNEKAEDYKRKLSDIDLTGR